MDQDSFLNGIEIWDTTVATSSSASLYTYGGVSIFSTYDSVDFSNGGSFLTLGGASISKSVNIGGNTVLFSTNNSTNTSTGALVIKGGIAIQGNAYGNFSNFQNLQSTNVSMSNLIATNSVHINLTTTNLLTTNITTTNLALSNNFSAQTINVTGTQNSTSTTTGTIVIAGGVGISQFIFAGRGFYGDMASTTNNSRPINLVDTRATISCWRWIQPNGANVGNPAIELIAGTSGNAGDPTNNWWDTYLDDSDAWVVRRRTGGISIPYMTICSNGNVGIGGNSAANLSAGYPLTVTGDGSITGNLTVGGTLLTTNMLATNLSIGSLILTNTNITKLTCSNSIITFETVGSMLATNINVTNLTTNNLKVNNSTFTNLLITTHSTINNLSVMAITTDSLLVTGATQNIVYIDAQNSQSNPATLVFTNTGVTGDFRIYSDGGDIQWQGGGGRALQMGAFHEIILTGGRTSAGLIPYINGNNTTYNTIIQNSNDSIGLTVQANITQTADLSRWVNNSGTILSKVDKTGNFYINSTLDSTSSTSTASITTLGGISIGKSINIGSTTISTNSITGALTIIGGIGVNSNIFIGSTADATSSLTPPSIKTLGGIVISKSIQIGSTVTSTSITSNSSITTLGGVSIAKDVYIGGILNTTNEVITNSTISNLYINGTLTGNAVYTNYSYVGVATTTSITSTTGTLKTSLTTGTLVAGVYAIDIGYSIAPNTSISALNEVAVYLNSSSITGFGATTGSTLIYDNITQPSQTTLLTSYFTSITQTFGNTINTLGLYYRTKTNGQTLAIGNASIRLYRIQ